MTRSTRRLAAIAAALSLVAAGSVAGAAAARAGQLDGDTRVGPAVLVVEPMDPQPIVAGHEGDVLLRVSIAMPATAVAQVPKAPKKKSRAKAARAASRR